MSGGHWSITASQPILTVALWLHSSILIKVSGRNAYITNESMGDRMVEVLSFLTVTFTVLDGSRKLILIGAKLLQDGSKTPVPTQP